MASIISAGTTSGTALNFSGDTSGVLQLASNGTTTALSISTAQVVTLTNALAVTSGGTGVTTSTGTGAVVLGTSPTITTPTISSLSSASATALTLQSAGTTAITVDTSQNVGIGTTSPRAKLEITDGTTNTAGEVVYQAYVVGADRSNLTEGNIAVQSNDAMAINKGGSIAFGGRAVSASASGANWSRIAGLKEDGTSSQYNGYLQFCTRSTAIGMTEKMRIDSSGNLLVGTTSQIGSAGTHNIVSTSNNWALLVRNSSASAGKYWVASPNSSNAYYVSNNSGVGVYITDGATSWTGTSDERLKNITGEISDGLNKVNSLRAVQFSWKSDNSNTEQVGLIAQDVQKVLPQAISEDNDGNLGIRYTEVIPLLVASIKELKAINDTQAETINALTARIVALEQA